MDENITNFGILTINNDIVNYEDFKLEYNVEMVIKEIEKFKYPMYQKIIDIFFGGIHFSIA